MGGYVYIMASKPNGVLYTGVTSDLARRVYEHREGLIEGFTTRYAARASSIQNFTRIFAVRFSVRRTSSIGRAPGR